MTTREVLLAAADLLERPGAWCQESEAKDKAGNPILYKHQKACSWCLVGAINKVMPDEAIADEAIRLLLINSKIEEPTEWNDNPNRTQAEVVAALRQAAGVKLAHKLGEEDQL